MKNETNHPLKLVCVPETFFENLKYYMREKRGFTEAFQIDNQKKSPFL